MKLVMMGTGPFAVPTFKMLLESEHECCLLVTRPQVVNRGKKAPPSPMRVIGEERGVPIFDPDDANAAASVETLRELEADLLVVCDYGQILSNEVLATAKLGGINLHGSLLPKYRGAAPVQWSVYNGDPQTGVCVIHMTPRLDGGPIICQDKTEILHDDTAETLEDRLSNMGTGCVQDAIQMLSSWDGETVIGKVQDQSQATKAPRLKKQMGEIDWTRSAVAIRNQIRAFKPWPGCYTDYERTSNNTTRLIIDWVELVSSAEMESRQASVASGTLASGSLVSGNLASRLQDAKPGQVVASDKHLLWVMTGDGILSIERIQPVGKRVMNVDEFLRGYALDANTVFGQQSES